MALDRSANPSRAPRAYAWMRARMWRRDDTASASLVSFIIGAGVFLVGATYLLHFAMQPPGASGDTLEQQELKSTGDHAMQVLLGTAGYPSSWSGAPDAVARLGILQAGTTSRIDATKFDALAHGSSSGSASNGYVDYEDARAALGLSGYEFHLRGAPVLSADALGDYGVLGMESYRVAYVGAYSGGSPTSAASLESATLDSLAIDYDGAAAPSGDLYQDDSSFLRTNLVPMLGVNVAQTTITSGSGSVKYDFAVVGGSVHGAVSSEPSPSRALAVNDTSAGMGYTRNREMRAILGTANFTSIPVSTFVRWKEFVGTSNDTGDYGFVELSPDGGATWYPVSDGGVSPNQRSTDSWGDLGGRWRTRAPVVSAATCGPCLGASSVLVGFHWVADSDTTTGQGWVVDDVTIDGTGFSQDFERPQYDMLIIGSKVAQNAFTANEVKSAIADFVNVYGGRLGVLGGEQNTQWLQPLFHVGISTTSSAVAAPDVTHPLLTVPNELDYKAYTTENKVWDFTGGTDDTLFTGVVETSGGEDILSVSNTGAFGAYGANGSVTLTTYLPYTMGDEQMHRFLANVLVYGKYRALYFDLGPLVPTGVPVATTVRTATIDMTNDNSGVYVEVALTMYVWKGSSSAGASTGGVSTTVPAPPRFLGAAPATSKVSLSWTWPISNGTSAVQSYAIWRGTSQGGESFYRTVPATAFAFDDTNVSNGVTYYYNLSATSAVGNSSSSLELSATPSTTPSVPTGLAATPGVGLVSLSWSAPGSTGGASLTNYTIYRGTSAGSVSALAAIAATCTTFIDANLGGAGVTRYYKVSAGNANGEGNLTGAVGGTSVTVPSAPVVTASANANNHTARVQWDLVSNPAGGDVTGYKVYGASSTGAQVYLATVSATSTDYYDGVYANGTVRYYKVTSINDAGESAMSNEAAAAFVGVPTQPASLTMAPKPLTAGVLTLTWSAPTDLQGGVLQGYLVFCGGSSGALSQVANAGLTLTYDLNVGAAGTSRFCTVAAYTNGGVGANSTEKSATTWSVPAAPNLVSATALSGHKITLVWTAPSSDMAITKYSIYRSTVSGAEVYVGETNGPELTYTDTGLSAGVRYYYKVTATSAAGEGALSNELSQIAL